MFDRGISAFKRLKNETRLTDGHWRLMDVLCHYTTPCQTYTKADVYREYEGHSNPFAQFLHHFCKRYAGEVAVAWANWNEEMSPLPRDAELLGQQWASDEANFKALRNLNRHVSTNASTGERLVSPSLDLTTLGNTNIIVNFPGENGYWHLNGGAISLPELFEQFGEHYTVAELFLWYHQAPKVCRRRVHAWGHLDVKAANLQRLETYGTRAHQKWSIGS